MPSSQNLNDFVTRRPPVTTLMIAAFIMGTIMLIYSNHLNKTSDRVINPDIQVDWNIVLSNLNDRQYCLENEDYGEKSENKLWPSNENTHTVIPLTSYSEYLPLKNYLSGGYHNNSLKYPLNFKMIMNATDLGILPLDMPKHAHEDVKQLYDIAHNNVFMEVKFDHRYESDVNQCINKNGEMTHENNIYIKDIKQVDIIDNCEKASTMVCIKFLVSNKVFEHTDLKRSKLPTQPITFDDKSGKFNYDNYNSISELQHTTFRCEEFSPGESSNLSAGSANNLDTSNENDINSQVCFSKLTFKTNHLKDQLLVETISPEDLIRIRHRLFGTAALLIGTCLGYLFYGSIVGDSGESRYEYF